MNYRELNPVESSLTTTNASFPMSTVIVISLEGKISSSQVRKAIDVLQERHHLLQACISKSNGQYIFIPTQKNIALSTYFREDANSWKQYAREALNTTYNTDNPLLNCIFIQSTDDIHSELIMVLHHAIIDGISARLLLTELLALVGGEGLSKTTQKLSITSASTFPKSYQGVQGFQKKLGFMAKQVANEVSYAIRGDKSPKLQDSKNSFYSLNIDPTTTRKILVAVGKKKLSLNSLISAAMLHAYYKQIISKKEKVHLRAISFADLRKKMSPPVSSDALGCYVSMVRLTIPVSPEDNVFDTAKLLWQQIYASGKSGELFLYAQMSELMMNMMLKFPMSRMGTTALSYIGKLDLKMKYGQIKPLDVKTYITNNQLGPSISAFGKLLYGQLSVDFMFLDDEFTPEQMKLLVSSTEEELSEVY